MSRKCRLQWVYTQQHLSCKINPKSRHCTIPDVSSPHLQSDVIVTIGWNIEGLYSLCTLSQCIVDQNRQALKRILAASESLSYSTIVQAHNYEDQHGSKRFEQPPEATAHENQQYVEARCMPRHGTRFAISRGNTGLEVLTYQGRRHPEVNQQVTSHTSQNSRRHPKLKPLDHTRRHPPRLEKTLSLGMGKVCFCFRCHASNWQNSS